MKTWIPLSLTLLLGQTPTAPVTSPPATEERSEREPGAEPPAATAEAGPSGARVGPEAGEQPQEPSEEQPLEKTGEEPSPERTEEEPSPEQEMKLLRAQLEALDAQLKAQQAEEEARRQEEQARLQTLEEEQEREAARARELEQLRQLRLQSLQQAYSWLITADQQLESGEFDVGSALTNAQRELSTALSTTGNTGLVQITRLIQRVGERIAVARESVEERDIYPARLELQAAGFELREAWQLTLNRSGATLVNQ